MLGLGDLALLVGVILIGVSNLEAGHADAWSLATLRAHPLGGTGADERRRLAAALRGGRGEGRRHAVPLLDPDPRPPERTPP